MGHLVLHNNTNMGTCKLRVGMVESVRLENCSLLHLYVDKSCTDIEHSYCGKQ